ncbi:hypothetical protein J6590_092319 [Homalodisca vitripennis]|nr:hypothetical protein J6590_092319 [Homalodisca vitripennis]
MERIQICIQRFEDWNLSSSSGGICINIYKNGEHKQEKKGKKRIQTFSKAVWSPVQTLSLHRMQVPSTIHEYENPNHTSTGYSGILILGYYHPDE